MVTYIVFTFQLVFFHGLCDNQFLHAWCVHDKQGCLQYEEQPDYHKKVELDHYEALGNPFNKANNHMISQVLVFVIERYSASAEERDTICCFLDLYDMRDEPKNTQKPEIDRLVSGQAAQSEFEKAFN